MSLTLTINSINRNDHIEWQSLNKSEGLTKEPDTLSFTLKKTPSKTIPTLGQSVELDEDGELIFAGVITERNEYVVGGILLGYAIKCKDLTHDFDRRLVVKSYVNETAEDIVKDIVDTFTTGFTYANVSTTTPTISSIKFNYEHPSKCLQRLAEVIGYDWYVDYTGDIHFFDDSSLSAPFNISDTSDTLEWKSLSFDRNILELKNSVIVRGGEYKTTILEAEAVDKYIADGTQRVFSNIYRYADIVVKVNGVSQSIGIDNISDPLLFDVLYNFQEKAIKFRDNNSPVDGDEVTIYGDAYIPLIAKVRDQVSIDEYGLYEHIEIDKSITSVSEAHTLAKSLLNKWSVGSWEGSFTTTETGLVTGQQININSVIMGIDKNFKITRIVGRARGSDYMEYTANFMASGEITFTDIMVKLLSKDKVNLDISDNEVLQRLEIFAEIASIEDTLNTPTSTTGPYKWAPSASSFKWNFGTWT